MNTSVLLVALVAGLLYAAASALGGLVQLAGRFHGVGSMSLGFQLLSIAASVGP